MAPFHGARFASPPSDFALKLLETRIMLKPAIAIRLILVAVFLSSLGCNGAPPEGSRRNSVASRESRSAQKPLDEASAPEKNSDSAPKPSPEPPPSTEPQPSRESPNGSQPRASGGESPVERNPGLPAPPLEAPLGSTGSRTQEPSEGAKPELTSPPNRLDENPVEPPSTVDRLVHGQHDFPFEIPEGWKRLSEREEIWIDPANQRVVVSGRICLRQGMLEMFACPRATKEHESIVATYPVSSFVHQALLLVGAEPGQPVQWEPEYHPARGPKVSIEVWYHDPQKQMIKVPAREMVRRVSDKSPLEIDWVFGGSRFVKDIDGQEYYAGNAGELICVSNFSSATIDLPIPSTDREGDLLFEANPDKIPALDTPVLLVLKPEIKSAEPQRTDK